MRPFIFTLGDIRVPSFFFMVMVGALAATFFSSWWAKREGSDQVALLDMGIIAIIASVIGARVFHIIVESPMYYLEKPIRVFYFWQGGYVSIGAYMFTIAAWLVYFWKRNLSTWRYMDLAAMGVPIIIFFVRVGCLSVGCCYGKPTDFLFHLTFNNPSSVPAAFGYAGIPLHASQIYFMINAIVMWAVFFLIYRRRKFYGEIISAFFIYYGISRFIIEFTRGDEDRGIWFDGSLSTGQIAMLISFIGGVILWKILSKRQNLRIRG